MSWSREQVETLIENYQRFPCLYNVKSTLYKNKHARLAALTEIEKTVKSVRPTITQAEIKAKFHALKTNFMNEHKKVQLSRHSGAGEDETYHPTVWYYEKMGFVLEHALPRLNIDSIANTDVEEAESGTQIYDDENNVVYHLEAGTPESIIDDDLPELEYDAALIEGPSVASTSSAASSSSRGSIPPLSTPGTSAVRVSKVKRKRTSEDQILVNVAGALSGINKSLSNQLPAVAEKCAEDIFGEFVASKLKLIKNARLKNGVESQIVSILYDGINQNPM